MPLTSSNPLASPNPDGRPGERHVLGILAVLLAVLTGLVTTGHAAVTLNLSSASGGFSIVGSSPNFNSGYGSVNGLGVGMPTTGVSILSSGVTGGVLYTTTYNVVISGMPTVTERR